MQNKILLYRGKRVDGEGYAYGLPVTKAERDKLYILTDGCLLYKDYEIIPESLARYVGEDSKDGEKVFDNDIMQGLFQTGMCGISIRKKKMNGFVNTMDVASVDEVSRRVLEEGGKIVVPKTPVPVVGWLVYCKDTEGNIFGMMQNDPMAK